MNPAEIVARFLDFNPRSPHGERRNSSTEARIAYQFQSTLPARGATIESLVWVGDTSFQSTLPARGATDYLDGRTEREGISIHAPRTGSDSPYVYISGSARNISIHAPRTGSDVLQFVQEVGA